MTEKFDRMDSMSEILRFITKCPTNTIAKEWRNLQSTTTPNLYHEDASWLIHDGIASSKHASEYYKFFGLE